MQKDSKQPPVGGDKSLFICESKEKLSSEIEDDREEPMGKAARSHSWLYEINFGEANLSIDLLSIAAPPNAYHHISSGEDEDDVEQMMNGGWCMSREGQMHHNVVAM